MGGNRAITEGEFINPRQAVLPPLFNPLGGGRWPSESKTQGKVKSCRCNSTERQRSVESRRASHFNVSSTRPRNKAELLSGALRPTTVSGDPNLSTRSSNKNETRYNFRAIERRNEPRNDSMKLSITSLTHLETVAKSTRRVPAFRFLKSGNIFLSGVEAVLVLRVPSAARVAERGSLGHRKETA